MRNMSVIIKITLLEEPRFQYSGQEYVPEEDEYKDIYTFTVACKVTVEKTTFPLTRKGTLYVVMYSKMYAEYYEKVGEIEKRVYEYPDYKEEITVPYTGTFTFTRDVAVSIGKKPGKSLKTWVIYTEAFVGYFGSAIEKLEFEVKV